MDRDELLKRLRGYEWKDFEAKEASWAAPKSAYETVSAFANTAGGWIVFGIKESNGSFEIMGVIKFDKVQSDFLNTLRSNSKLNRAIQVREQLMEEEGKPILLFYIPESTRAEKPIYLNSDIRESYIRRGGSDQKCTREEIERFIRDASTERYDNEVLSNINAETCFDEGSVTWYRRAFNEKQPGRDETLSDIAFLSEWGFVIEHEEKLVPTRAAVLIFGKGKYVRQVLPRPVVDYQRVNVDALQWTPDRRWDDRIVIEENLIQSWLILVERYMRYAERPFASIDAATLRRHDEPPDYVSFREAAINLLIHQDYGDHTRMSVIQFYRDRTIFTNPGDAFATTEQLLNPGMKEVRNPSIVNAFRRIGLSDQAGTGIRSIMINWRRLGYVPPIIHNEKAEKCFELCLLKDPLLTDRQQLFQASLGAHLSEDEADLLAYACKNQGILTLTEARAVTSRTRGELRKILQRLVTQVIFKVVEDGVRYEVSDHLRERLTTTQQLENDGNLVCDRISGIPEDLSTAQVGVNLLDLSTAHVSISENLTEMQWQIIELCDTPQSLATILAALGVSNRGGFKSQHLDQLIAGGVIRMTNPDKPKASNQKYVLTEAGVALKARRLQKDNE